MPRYDWHVSRILKASFVVFFNTLQRHDGEEKLALVTRTRLNRDQLKSDKKQCLHTLTP